MTRIAYKKRELENIVKLAQKGDIKALEEIIRRIQKHIYAIFSHLTTKKEDIADLTQEALLKIARNIHQLKDPKRFKSWVNQIVTNIFYDHARKKTDIFVEITEEKFAQIKDKIGCEPGERCLFTELEKLVNAALMTLPKNLRITLVLREFEGLSYNDIAQITDTALGTVKSRISRAREKLLQELKEFI